MDGVGPTMVEQPKKKDNHILKVYYKDSTFKSYSLPDDVTCAEVCAKFASKFLRISERAASHFSLHLIIHGKDLKQLKPTDRPIKIQKELCDLNYIFNTAEDENYFLFCLNDETKNKMNDLCERNSILLIPPPSDTHSRKERRSQTLQSQTTQQKTSSFSRTHSVLALVKPAKEKLAFLKRKQGDRPNKSPEPKVDPETEAFHPVSPQPDKEKREEKKEAKVRRESTPTRIAHQLQHVLGFATHVNPHTNPTLTLSNNNPEPVLTPASDSAMQPETISTSSEPEMPAVNVSPNSSPSSASSLSASLPPTIGSSPHSYPSPLSGFTDSPPITPDSPGLTISSPTNTSPHPISTPGSSPDGPLRTPASLSPKSPPRTSISPRLHAPPTHALPPTPQRKNLEVRSPQIRSVAMRERPVSVRLSGPPKSAKEDLDDLISSVFEKAENKEEDVEKVMEHMFDWFQGGEKGGESAPAPHIEVDAEEDFDDILDALDKLSTF